MDYDASLVLHRLVARLDQVADQILRAEMDLPYRRYLTLFMVGNLGTTTQRALAERLSVTEPSVSRMTNVLVKAGWLDAPSDPSGGNRRELKLTLIGEDLVARCGQLLEGRLVALMEASNVPYGVYIGYTEQLLETLDDAKRPQMRRAVISKSASGGDYYD